MGRAVKRIAAGALIVALLAAPASRAGDCRVTWDSVGKDAEALVKAPFTMTGQGAVQTAVAGAAIGASMIWLDGPADRLVRENARAWQPAHKLASLTSWYGESGTHLLIVSAGLVGVVAAGGYFSDDDRMLDTAAIMGEAVVFSGIIGYAGKALFGRRRPYNDEGPHRFEWFVSPGNEPSVSFPSGHASTAFALAGAGAGRYPYWYVQIPAYVLATSAALQRMDARKHWASDVLAGGLLGYAVANFLVDRYDCGSAEPGGAATLSLSFSMAF
jgi:undecaprenyl-diphosphatase